MSSIVVGAEGWSWIAFRRMAEPVVSRFMRLVDDVDASPEVAPLAWQPELGEAVSLSCEEDAERWDGLG